MQFDIEDPEWSWAREYLRALLDHQRGTRKMSNKAYDAMIEELKGEAARRGITYGKVANWLSKIREPEPPAPDEELDVPREWHTPWKPPQQFDDDPQARLGLLYVKHHAVGLTAAERVEIAQLLPVQFEDAPSVLRRALRGAGKAARVAGKASRVAGRLGARGARVGGRLGYGASKLGLKALYHLLRFGGKAGWSIAKQIALGLGQNVADSWQPINEEAQRRAGLFHGEDEMPFSEESEAVARGKIGGRRRLGRARKASLMSVMVADRPEGNPHHEYVMLGRPSGGKKGKKKGKQQPQESKPRFSEASANINPATREVAPWKPPRRGFNPATGKRMQFSVEDYLDADAEPVTAPRIRQFDEDDDWSENDWIEKWRDFNPRTSPPSDPSKWVWPDPNEVDFVDPEDKLIPVHPEDRDFLVGGGSLEDDLNVLVSKVYGGELTPEQARALFLRRWPNRFLEGSENSPFRALWDKAMRSFYGTQMSEPDPVLEEPLQIIQSRRPTSFSDAPAVALADLAERLPSFYKPIQMGEQPPGLMRADRQGTSCANCKHFKDTDGESGRCKLYDYVVKQRMTCDVFTATDDQKEFRGPGVMLDRAGGDPQTGGTSQMSQFALPGGGGRPYQEEEDEEEFRLPGSGEVFGNLGGLLGVASGDYSGPWHQDVLSFLGRGMAGEALGLGAGASSAIGLAVINEILRRKKNQDRRRRNAVERSKFAAPVTEAPDIDTARQFALPGGGGSPYQEDIPEEENEPGIFDWQNLAPAGALSLAGGNDWISALWAAYGMRKLLKRRRDAERQRRGVRNAVERSKFAAPVTEAPDIDRARQFAEEYAADLAERMPEYYKAEPDLPQQQSPQLVASLGRSTAW